MPGKSAAAASPQPQNSRPQGSAGGDSSKKQTFDPDDFEYIKDLQRPAVIKEDLHLMECSRRVKQILDSQTFREELEKLILSERGSNGSGETVNLKPLQQLSDLLTRTQPVQSGIRGIGSHAIVPIADLRGAEGAKFSKQERLMRNKFASLFRLIDLFRWSQGISNHCTLRFSNEHILINPFCLMYHEVTAGLLLKVDFNGNPADESATAAAVNATSCGINDAAFLLHAAIYKSRPDVTCIIHLLTPVVGAVAAMKCGLLPISQEAMIIGEISYHDFQGYCTANPQEAASVASDLGLTNKVLLMRNNGFLICASSIEEAFHLTYNLILACETQIRAVRAGFDNLVIPSQEAQRKAHETASRDGGGGVNKTPDNKQGGGIKWKVGELEWEAWMRVLDNAGFRTGHVYRQSLANLKKPVTSPYSEVATPPAATSYGVGLDSVDTVYTGHKVLTSKSDAEKIRWLHSPNLYQKIEYNESGSVEPKKITKWIQNESPAHMQQIKVNTSHQFLPPSSVSPDPKELKDKQKKLKELRSADNISAGPQSKVLEGVSAHDAIKMKEEADVQSQPERIIIGAASKAIVDRDYRHNQQIFSQLYQTNPFAGETDQGIQKYMNEIEQRTRVLTYQNDSGTFDRCDEVGSGGSQSPESVSLMQAAREHNLLHSVETPPPTRNARETTFGATADSYNVKGTVVSPSKQYSQPQQSPGIPEEKALSEDEAHAADGTHSPDKKDKKKKRFRTLSFLKSKKDKEKK